MEDERSEHPHRGITMHRLSVGGDFPGLLFAVGSVLIFLIAIPALWYVVAGALVVGLVIAVVLQFVHNRPDHLAPLSLKSAAQDSPFPAKTDSSGHAQSSNRAGPLGLRMVPLVSSSN
jgi:hypothetical protein